MKRKAKAERKNAAERGKLSGTGPDECAGCGLEPPRVGGALPYGWSVHCIDDERYAKGYRMPLCCGDACRKKEGFGEQSE